MTAQEAAYKVLREAGRPLPTKEIAKRAISAKLIHSNALSPVDSIAQTIEKNIRDGIYNRPKLEFVATTSGRMVGLPGATKAVEGGRVGGNTNVRMADLPVIPEHETWMIALPARLLNKVDLCVQVGIGSSREGVAAQMLSRGLEAASEEIASAVRNHLRSASANDVR